MIANPVTRRTLLGLLPLVMAGRSRAGDKPYEARFFSAGFDGVRHVGGFHLRMSPGWKTYWRVPGAGGIPPEITATGSNTGQFSFACPMPRRMSGEDGESIGYKDEVVFPWALTAVDVAQPVNAELSAFIGVCETVCIPVPVRETMALQPVAMATREAALLAEWQARVPVAHDAVSHVTAGADASEIFVDVALLVNAQDVFIEGNPLHFYSAPLWRDGGRTARLRVRGAASPDDLTGQPLRITLDAGGQGLEQTVTAR